MKTVKILSFDEFSMEDLIETLNDSSGEQFAFIERIQ